MALKPDLCGEEQEGWCSLPQMLLKGHFVTAV